MLVIKLIGKEKALSLTEANLSLNSKIETRQLALRCSLVELFELAILAEW